MHYGEENDNGNCNDVTKGHHFPKDPRTYMHAQVEAATSTRSDEAEIV